MIPLINHLLLKAQEMYYIKKRVKCILFDDVGFLKIVGPVLIVLKEQIVFISSRVWVNGGSVRHNGSLASLRSASFCKSRVSLRPLSSAYQGSFF